MAIFGKGIKNREPDKARFQENKKLVHTRIKEIVSGFNRNPNIQNLMRKRLDSLIERLRLSGDHTDKSLSKEVDCFVKNRKVSKLVSQIYSEDEKSLSVVFLIYDGAQLIRDRVIDPMNQIIISELKKDKEIRKTLKSIDAGDGDEGCIYVTFKNK